jgi:1,4-dihydroxy-2-naphthoate octaprenyltransferase
VPAFFMTFNLLLLNEFPDEEADRAGGRKNIVLMLGRKGAALVYAAAAILTPAAIVAAVVLRALPPHALAAVVPSVLLARPLAWAFGDAREPVPVPALGANVAWNLATNTVLALALAAAVLVR